MQPDASLYIFDDRLRERMAQNLAEFSRNVVEGKELRQAGVAIVVTCCRDTGEGSVLLTLRPKNLKRHSNQFALPGGRLDAGETAADAALRELHEELGLELQPRAIIGTLDDYPTRSGFCITPVVIWAGGEVELRPDPGEVEQVFHVPLKQLDSPDIPYLYPAEDGQSVILSAPLPVIGGHLYAPTAAILYQFREIALHRRQTRVASYDQPQFAWK